MILLVMDEVYQELLLCGKNTIVNPVTSLAQTAGFQWSRKIQML